MFIFLIVNFIFLIGGYKIYYEMIELFYLICSEMVFKGIWYVIYLLLIVLSRSFLRIGLILRFI